MCYDTDTLLHNRRVGPENSLAAIEEKMNLQPYDIAFPRSYKHQFSCAYCKVTFGANRCDKKYCSKQCRQAASTLRKTGKRRGKRGATLYSAGYTMCSMCGKEFYLNMGSVKEYCSNSCRQKAYRERKNASQM